MVFGLQTQPKSWLTGYTFWVNHYRPVFESELESTLEDSLRLKNEQMIRKANKAVFGQYLKNIVDCTVTSSNPSSPLIIDGGWLLYQITSFTGFETYGDIANEY